MPDIDLKSVTSLLGASAITGDFIYIGLSFSLIVPGICYPILIKGDENLKFLIKGNSPKGFFRLSIAGLFLLTSALLTFFFILSSEKYLYWYLILLSIIFLLLCIYFLNDILRLESFSLRRKIKISIKLLCYSWMIFSLNVISSIVIISITSKYLIQGKDLFKVTLLLFLVYAACITLNKFVSSGKILEEKGSLKFLQFLLISFLIFTMITIPLESVHIIPASIVRLYGWGDMKNATLIIDYKGCQVFDQYDVRVEDGCVKSKDTYRVNNVHILLGLGKNYFLRCRREIGSIERYLSKDATGQNSFKNEIELTLPTTSIISWSRSRF